MTHACRPTAPGTLTDQQTHSPFKVAGLDMRSEHGRRFRDLAALVITEPGTNLDPVKVRELAGLKLLIEITQAALIAVDRKALNDLVGLLNHAKRAEREPREAKRVSDSKPPRVLGRRGGKSRAAAVLRVYLACLCDYADVPAIGEKPMVLCLAQNQIQARVELSYALGLIRSVSMLSALVKSEAAEAILLTTGIALEVRSASFRVLRGATFLGCVCDELAFWHSD